MTVRRVSRAQTLDHVLRQDEHDCPRIDDGIDGRAPDFGLLTVAALDDRAVAGVLQFEFGDDFTQRLLSSIGSMQFAETNARGQQGSLMNGLLVSFVMLT